MQPFSNIDCEQTVCNYYVNQLSEQVQTYALWQVPVNTVDSIEGSSMVIWERPEVPKTFAPFLSWQRHCKGLENLQETDVDCFQFFI